MRCLLQLLSMCAAIVAATASYPVERPVTKVCDGRLDVAYLLDVSSSINDKEWAGVEALFVAITNALTVGEDYTRIGIITFSTDVWTICDLNDCGTAQCIIDKIHNIKYTKESARTNIAGAFEMAYQEVFRPGNGNRSEIPDVCICFSDGKANERADETKDQANELRARGCRIIVVAIAAADIEKLKEISAIEDIFDATEKSFDNLIDLVEPIVTRTCVDVVGDCRCTSHLGDESQRKRRSLGGEL